MPSSVSSAPIPENGEVYISNYQDFSQTQHHRFQEVTRMPIVAAGRCHKAQPRGYRNDHRHLKHTRVVADFKA